MELQIVALERWIKSCQDFIKNPMRNCKLDIIDFGYEYLMVFAKKRLKQLLHIRKFWFPTNTYHAN